MEDWSIEVLGKLSVVTQLVRSGHDPTLADPNQMPDQAIRISGGGDYIFRFSRWFQNAGRVDNPWARICALNDEASGFHLINLKEILWLLKELASALIVFYKAGWWKIILFKSKLSLTFEKNLMIEKKFKNLWF